MTIKFKMGDHVKMIRSDATGIIGAKAGATGVVSMDHNSDKNTYLYVKWDRSNPLHGQQNDGGYYASDFALVSQPHTDEHVIMLFEDGRYKPATTPKVLKSKSQAVTVADIMAKANPGSEFVVFRAVAHAKAPITLADIVTVYAA